MTTPALHCKRAALAACGALVISLFLTAGCGKTPKPAGPAAGAKPAAGGASTNAAMMGKTNASTDLVSSFDDDPPPANKGRDPFFPDSLRRNPIPVVPTNPVPVIPGVVDPQLRLQSVTGSKGRRVVAINNHIFMQTDPPESVKVPGGGAVMVKIINVGEDFVDVQIDGVEIRHLTMGQKK